MSMTALSSGAIFSLDLNNDVQQSDWSLSGNNRSVFQTSAVCNNFSGDAGVININTNDDMLKVSKYLALHCYEGRFPIGNNILYAFKKIKFTIIEVSCSKTIIAAN